MASRAVRGLSVYLTVLQLFTQGMMASAKADGSEEVKIPTSGGTTIVLAEDSKEGNPIYQRMDVETGELTPISIFDKENLSSHQYGASQRVFRFNFDELMKDPLIWEEMQKYYPVDSFESEEEAMFFYEKYFNLIYDCGCGYAAAADYVFHMFEGKEEKFFERFGFPMYSKPKKEIDFNYELFMLKFFNFANLDITDQRKAIKKSMEKDLWEFRLFKLLREDSPRLSRQDVKNMTDEEWDQWKAEEKAREAKVDYLSEKYKNAKNVYTNFGIKTDAAFGYLYIFLANHGIQINTSMRYGNKKSQEDDIIATNKFVLYQVNPSGSIGSPKEEKGEHYMYVTEVEDDGDVFVSSWGNMYLLDNSNATWTESVVITTPVR